VSLFRGVMPVSGAIMMLICVARLVGLWSGRLQPADFLPRTDG